MYVSKRPCNSPSSRLALNKLGDGIIRHLATKFFFTWRVGNNIGGLPRSLAEAWSILQQRRVCPALTCTICEGSESSRNELRIERTYTDLCSPSFPSPSGSQNTTLHQALSFPLPHLYKPTHVGPNLSQEHVNSRRSAATPSTRQTAPSHRHFHKTVDCTW